jgi:hypothetical protein
MAAADKTLLRRDHTIDYMRGIGCILMAMAHLRFFDSSEGYTSLVDIVGLLAEFGTVFFFAISGITSQMQGRRYSFSNIVISNLFLFVLGLSYSVMIHPNLYGFFTFEIFQIIAVGSAAVALVEKYFQPSAQLYMLLALLVYIAKMCFENFLPGFDGGGVLLNYAGYMPYDLIPAGEKPDVIVNPGFPVFPWLFLFFAGCAAYQLSNRTLLLTGVACLVLLYVLIYGVGIKTRFYSKWDMPIGHFILQIATLGFGLVFSRFLAKFEPGKYNVVLYFGRNSLIFFFLHGIGLVMAVNVARYNQYLGWLTAVVVTFVVMKLLEKVPQSRLMNNMLAWLIVAAVIMLLPVLVYFYPELTSAVLMMEFLLGILVAKNYPQLGQAIKGIF